MNDFKNIFNIVNNNNCAGCGACSLICPCGVIKMEYNDEGFFVPKVDLESCSNCELCLKTCPQNIKSEMIDPIKILGAQSKNIKDINVGTSGGIFQIIAKYVIENKGVVFGCILDNNLNAVHAGVDNIEKLDYLSGSKYVQSNPANTFSEAKIYLDAGRFVLFSGTPCQIAGLKKYLGKYYDNLITVDIVCNGVTSPDLFRRYIDWLQKRYHCKLKNIIFRSKGKKKKFMMKKEFENKIIHSNGLLDPYYSAFLSEKIYRENCYQCFYAQKKRISDLTLGDFWGVEKVNSFLNTENGASLIFLNTHMGINIFSKIKEQMISFECSYEAAARLNNNIRSCKGYVPKERADLLLMIREHDDNTIFEKDFKKFRNWKKIIYNELPLNIRKVIKKNIK